ncbi:MAG: transketolase [Candidatus Diapherotrites archaeon]|nr:transketolase [Candidatus Diapherotrites archaeon]
MQKLSIEQLKEKARQHRVNIVRMTSNANSGHPGGSLSATDLLTVLYCNYLNFSPQNAKSPDRDRFILSKGHASPIIYSVLADKGFFPKEQLMTFRLIGSKLQGHPSRLSTPGIEISTGSLAQGFSAALGMALAAKADGRKNKVVAMLGDGEIEEGQVWETAMVAGHHKLENFITILDRNGFQNDGAIKDEITLEPIKEKFEAFGWNVLQIDGHDLKRIAEAYEQAWQNKGKPAIIIAKTVKGKGVSFMENDGSFHGKAANPEQFEIAMKELGEK